MRKVEIHDGAISLGALDILAQNKFTPDMLPGMVVSVDEDSGSFAPIDTLARTNIKRLELLIKHVDHVNQTLFARVVALEKRVTELESVTFWDLLRFQFISLWKRIVRK